MAQSIGGYGSGSGKGRTNNAYGTAKYVNPGYLYEPYQFNPNYSGIPRVTPDYSGLGLIDSRNSRQFALGNTVPVVVTGYQPPTGTGGSFQYRKTPVVGSAIGASAGRTVPKPTSRSTSSTARRSAGTVNRTTPAAAASQAADPLAASLAAPSQVATDFGSFVSSLQTAPMYRGGVNYSETLGRYVRPSDYGTAPTFVNPAQYQADVARMTAGVAADPSQRSTAGPLGLSAYNLVPTLPGVRGTTYGENGQAIDSGPVTYRSSADAYRIATAGATPQQLADPAYRAVLESFAREGGLIGPSAEEQALLRQRIDAEVAAAQQRGQQATAYWNQMNPGISTPTAMGTSAGDFVPFIGTDQYGNSVRADDPNALLKIRQALVQSMGGGYDPYANVNDQGALLG